LVASAQDCDFVILSLTNERRIEKVVNTDLICREQAVARAPV